MDINIDTLVIEVTRRCNQCCAHCLRGNSEKLDSLLEPEQIFKGISRVGQIVFSGGEPTLNVPFIRKCVDYLVENDILVDGCYIVTNGLVYSEEMVDQVRRLMLKKFYDDYGYGECSASLFLNWFQYETEDGGLWGIPVSQDPYHDEPDPETLLKWITSGFYRNDKVYDFRRGGIILEGNALRNGLEGRELSHKNRLYFYKDQEISVEQVYVNCYGEVFSDCDYSYETQDKEDLSVGNVKNGGLAGVIQKHTTEQEVA